jgi:hypothetical protein
MGLECKLRTLFSGPFIRRVFKDMHLLCPISTSAGKAAWKAADSRKRKHSSGVRPPAATTLITISDPVRVCAARSYRDWFTEMFPQPWAGPCMAAKNFLSSVCRIQLRRDNVSSRKQKANSPVWATNAPFALRGTAPGEKLTSHSRNARLHSRCARGADCADCR